MPTVRTASATVKTAKATMPATAPAGKPIKTDKARKAAKTAKAAQAVAGATDQKPHAKPRAKLVRDSFTMPQQDFDLIDLLKTRALSFQSPVKKSELLRAGLQALAALPDSRLKQRLDKLEQLKTGRPKKAG